MQTNHNILKTSQPDLQTIKAKQKATWEDGDYASFARYMEDGAIEILENWNIPTHVTLLDVGCGSGQTAIPAAKKGIKVYGVDIAENLIQHARQRAFKAKITASFDVGDAENLPYEDNQFDVVISLIGAMFAPRPQRVVSEFARVVKPGGQLFMANWTPSSMPAQMFKAVSSIVPPPTGIESPVLWGDANTVIQRLSDDFTDLKLRKKYYPQWHYPFDISDLVSLFRSHFGPVKRAFDVADVYQQAVLQEKLETIYAENSEQHNGILTITGGEYLEIIATRR